MSITYKHIVCLAEKVEHLRAIFLILYFITRQIQLHNGQFGI